jgi:nuclear pore complex protein Nup133
VSEDEDTALTVWQIFKQLVRSLLQGKALSVEDTADALSMKDNDTTIGDYATALHLLARADVSKPQGV